jgi:hypothetical protein
MSSSATTCCSAFCRCCSDRVRNGLSIVLCGTSLLHWRREDGAPHSIGLPPSTTKEQRDDYAAIDREHDRLIHQPVADRLKSILADHGRRAVVDAPVRFCRCA